MRILSGVEREIIVTADQAKLLNLITERAVQITTADRGEIRLLDPITDELVSKARFVIDSTKEQPQCESVDETLGRWVADQGRSILVGDLTADRRTAAGAHSSGAVLSVPLVARDRQVIGVLTMASHRSHAFEQQHQRMLEALANQTVVAIQNVQAQEHLLAAERIATLGDLAGPLMHKLKDNFGLILWWAQEILNEGDETSRSKASRILDRMQALRVHADMLKIWSNEKPQTLDLRQIIKSALAESSVPHEKMFTSTVLPPDLPLVLGTAQILKDLVQNLIQNAKEAMPKGGTLAIEGQRVERRGKLWAIVTVRDNGPGIPEQDQEKIFQSDYSTKPGSGGGFGLWWARLYVHRLGGRLTVESQPGEGACFTIMLPARVEQIEQRTGD
jgi:signal transduction histidine kinase